MYITCVVEPSCGSQSCHTCIGSRICMAALHTLIATTGAGALGVLATAASGSGFTAAASHAASTSNQK